MYRLANYSCRSDWGGLLARTQAMAQACNTVEQQIEALGADVIQFADQVRVSLEALLSRVGQLRAAAQAADQEFADVEDEILANGDVPAEIRDIYENASSGLDDFLDEIEAKLDGIG